MAPTVPASRWNEGQLLSLWSQLEPQVHPFAQVLVLDGEFFRYLDRGAKRFIARKFMNHTLEPVMYCRDGTGFDRFFLGAPRNFVAGDGILIYPIGAGEAVWMHRPKPVVVEVAEATPTKSTKIRRPPNAYILYRKERHHLVKQDNPGITNNEISQILGKAWNLESRQVRFKYKELSEKMKKELLEKYPDYQYKPRRPSERRRRARRNDQAQGSPATGDEEEELDSDIPVMQSVA